jgi:diaminohydroxyphosphoribosylaminopyrimidine deaminase/5-amino-6-(5-phosphoribosylamino)uracil reductase
LRVVLDRRGRLKGVPDDWLHLHCQSLAEVMAELFERKVQSLIVEGGRQVLDAFIAEGLYDEVVVFRGDVNYDAGLKAPALPVIPQNRLKIIAS